MLRTIFNKAKKIIVSAINLYRAKKKWRDNNRNNSSAIKNDVNSIATVENFTYGVIYIPYMQGKLKIGSMCSIADDVTFLTAGEHFTNHLSTFPFNEKVLGRSEMAAGGTTKGDIIVEDDVWIGYGATILSGVTIGQGAIIGAGAVVAKDIPPYAIYAGNRIIKYRFPDEVIEKLLKFDYSRLTKKDIADNIELLYSEIDESFFESDFYKNHLKTADGEN